MNVYAEIFDVFNKAKIKYLIVGGVAVNLYGYARFTGDVDILLALDSENLKRMNKLMEKRGYVPRLPVELHDLSDEKKLKNWIKTKGLKAYTFISADKPHLDIDILVEDSLVFEKHYKDKTVVEAWKVKLPVVSLDYLIAMKQNAGRDKDILDLKELLKLKDL
ncbi:hypothetical protein COY05_01970 [Candidatus Peregrinibacteria bacterium CG_4_10_14_0_2_um_filter_38_24]|nr:MAG: hypothetical protein COY05_01970 [Candidatus Peregrinibacteria bacterium CG_4_10_14_0_2_um_filter_38_24]